MKQEFCSWHPHKRVDISVRNRNADWHLCARGNPLLVSLKLDAYLVVEDPQVAILPPRHCVRLNQLHILRHHADVSSIAAIIAEAIVAKAVGEMAEENNVVFERDVRSPSAATSTATATPATAAGTCTTAAATATRTHAAAPTTATHACAAARGCHVCAPTGANIP
jgi:hypothetical protein